MWLSSSPNLKKRGSSVPKEVSNTQILDAALGVISERGYAGATTRQIAAAAGVNEVTLFRRFGTKLGLLKAGVDRTLKRFAEGDKVTYTGDVQADLVRLVTVHGELARGQARLLPVLVSEVRRHPELMEVVHTFHEHIVAMAELIARYQEEGVLVQEPPLQAMASLVEPLVALSILSSLPDGIQPPQPDPEEHVRRYLGGRRAQ